MPNKQKTKPLYKVYATYNTSFVLDSTGKPVSPHDTWTKEQIDQQMALMLALAFYEAVKTLFQTC